MQVFSQGSGLIPCNPGGCQRLEDNSLLTKRIEFCLFLLIFLIPYSKNGEIGLNPLQSYFYNVLHHTYLCHILKFSILASDAFFKVLTDTVERTLYPSLMPVSFPFIYSKGNHYSAFAIYIHINNAWHYVACFRKRASHYRNRL